MYKTIFFASSLLIASLINHIHAKEPNNIQIKKQSLIKYFEKGDYSSDLKLIVNNAKKYLTLRTVQNSKNKVPKKLAIVLDIDDTTLSNYPYMKSQSFGGTIAQFDKNVTEYKLKAIKPMRDFYNFAKKKKVSIFFVTGRKIATKMGTIKNLKQSGYNNWQNLYFKPTNYSQNSVIPYKASIRKLIETKGYTIIESIGDQKSDLKGGYAEKTYKLPNPFYYIP